MANIYFTNVPPDLIRDVLDPAGLGDEGLAGPPVAGVAGEGPHRHAAVKCEDCRVTAA